MTKKQAKLPKRNNRKHEQYIQSKHDNFNSDSSNYPVFLFKFRNYSIQRIGVIYIFKTYKPLSLKTSLNDKVIKIKLIIHTLNLRSVKKLSCKFYEAISIIHGNVVF